MKPSKEDRDLEERIRSAIGTEELTFDFDKWKAGHQRQIERFEASVSKESAEPAQVSIWLIIVKSRITQLAAVVVVALTFCWFSITDRVEPEQQWANESAIAVKSQTPAELMSVISLTMAFRDGDMEAMEKQFEEAEKKLNPGPRESITIEQLICELEECEEI